MVAFVLCKDALLKSMQSVLFCIDGQSFEVIIILRSYYYYSLQTLFSQFLVNGFEIQFFTEECYKIHPKLDVNQYTRRAIQLLGMGDVFGRHLK